MRVAIVSVFVDYHRAGGHHRGVLQPQVGPLIAALLPDEADVEIVNDAWTDPDWSRSYDLVFLSCMHSDFDRARQLSHYWRRRGAKTVVGGIMAGTHTQLCAPWFDAVVVGDPEDTVPQVYADAKAGRLKRLYRSFGHRPDLVPTPRVERVAHQQWFPMSMEVTRGCPYACDFCALTGAGTRFETRPVQQVVRDIRRMQSALAGIVKGWRRRLVMFYDNNLAGNLRYFRELCDALQPLGIEWATCLTFNVLTQRELLKRMFDSGCRAVFVGLETFNPRALADFHKPQNKLSQVRDALAQARDEGILVTAGLILSPLHDDPDYIRSLPQHLSGSGLHVPTFLCFETPIPGTPFFDRLARQPEPALLPHALLRDFNAYTLVARPHHCSPEEFIAAYRDAVREIYAPRRRLAKLADDLPRLLKRGSWTAAGLDLGDQLMAGQRHTPGRTYLAGTDLAPPERVPFADDDFESEAERLRVCSPTVVTDGEGRVLPAWRMAHTAGQPVALPTHAPLPQA
jgi:radical SAM superfamily enzyme YgiQ (UPF0313 family)